MDYCLRLHPIIYFFCCKFLVLSGWPHCCHIKISDSFCSSASSYDSDREASGRSRKHKKSSRSRKSRERERSKDRHHKRDKGKHREVNFLLIPKTPTFCPG